MSDVQGEAIHPSHGTCLSVAVLHDVSTSSENRSDNEHIGKKSGLPCKGD